MENRIPCPLPGWEIVRVIGSGSYGKVYEIEKIDDFGSTTHSALKVISIPESSSEIKAYRDDGLDDASITALLKNRVKDISEEFQLMSALRGQTNIVSYEDHKTVPHQDDPGYDILIRMELLTSMPDYFKEHFAAGKMDENTVIQLGIDICRALELCWKKNIIHRDIKPQNIFVNTNGDFKLGDFGIARTLDHSTHATKAGTYGYMAPEVYRAEKYNACVDIYSLGLVMYWMLNERRGPFLPLPPETPKPSQNREALDRRMGGEAFPRPRHAGPALTDVILKACAFAPGDRYSSPTEMRLALENIDRTAAVLKADAFVPEEQSSSPAEMQPAPEDIDMTAAVLKADAFVPEDRSSGPAEMQPAPEDIDMTAVVFKADAFAPKDRSSDPAEMQPAPEDIDMTAAVLKADAFAPENRSSGPAKMQSALEDIDATIAESAPAEPTVAEPTIAEPVFAGPVPTEHIFTGPVPTGPIPTGPIPTGPVPTGPIFTGPVPTEPIFTGPVPTEPIFTGPVPTEPIFTGPVPTEPVFTGPIPAEPVPGGSVREMPSRKKQFIFAGIAVAAVALIIGLTVALGRNSSVISSPEDEPSVSVPAETPELLPSSEPESWGDSFPVEAYLNGDWIETHKQYRSARLEVVHEEKTDGSQLISTEKHLAQDWSDWQDSAPERSDLVEVESRTIYSYRKLRAVQVSNKYNTATWTEYVWGAWTTSSTPVQANSSTQVNTSTQYRYRVYEYDYCYAVDWSEFADNMIAPDDGRIVNVATLFRTAATESEQKVSMDNFPSGRDAKSVYADVPSDEWYYDSISAVTELGILNTDEFLYFFPEQPAKVGDLIRAAVAVNRIYNGECGVLPEDADLYYLIENDAMDRGIIYDGEFPDMEANVTRLQAATILYRVLPLKELAAINEITNITDMDSGSDVYRFVYQFAQAGIVTFPESSGAFFPENEITRAEMASMLNRLMYPDKRYTR